MLYPDFPEFDPLNDLTRAEQEELDELERDMLYGPQGEDDLTDWPLSHEHVEFLDHLFHELTRRHPYEHQPDPPDSPADA
jgi:hypothetical protein